MCARWPRPRVVTVTGPHALPRLPGCAKASACDKHGEAHASTPHHLSQERFSIPTFAAEAALCTRECSLHGHLTRAAPTHGGRQHRMKMVRCRLAFRRLASFSTARSISTSLRLAFCGAPRVSDPRGSAPARTPRRVPRPAGAAACCRQHRPCTGRGAHLKVGAGHHRLDEVAALQVGVLEVAPPAVGRREVGPAQVLRTGRRRQGLCMAERCRPGMRELEQACQTRRNCASSQAVQLTWSWKSLPAMLACAA